jgi:hypothetical protein
MNRFLVSSALIGSVMGVYHGRMFRRELTTVPQDVAYGIRDGILGAAIFPFIIPIGVYQIATKAPPNQCVFSVLEGIAGKLKKSEPITEQ